MLQRFLSEEKGQGAIEYILLAGGIIVAAVVIFAIYSKMTGSAANKLENVTEATTDEMSRLISDSIANMSST